MPKLRLEVQLFQIKLLLLRDDMSRDIRRKFCSEASLQNIKRQLDGLVQIEARWLNRSSLAGFAAVGFDLAEAIAKVPAHKRRN